MSAGDMLRQAREAHGLHVEMVAAALKVPPQKLEALEADDIDALPDPVFARALAASVARALRIDPAPVLAKLPGAPQAALAEADRSMSGNIRQHPHRGAGRQPQGRLLPRPLLALVAVLLIGAAAVFWLPQSVFDGAGAWLAKLTDRPGASSAGASSEGAAAPAAPPGTVVESVVAAAAPTSAAAPATEAAPSAPVAAPEPVASAAGDVLVLTAARGESWITVSEAGGKVLLRRLVASGETVKLSGSLPLSVVVGRASNVDVLVRGKAFDLAPLARSGGVARFEVKS
ncbi:MAG: helix-turn-helix domain-containing protein [Rhodocyclaceae bacterium]|nr:helix-turn-helix domain-containing protein [Rhodocyclaceae bacterium]